MATTQLSYSQAREDVQPGDAIGFSHCGCEGAVINLATGGIPCRDLSHVAIAANHPETKTLVLYESLWTQTAPCLIQRRPARGVQCQRLPRRVRMYPGRVWRYPLAKPLSSLESILLTESCVKAIGLDYDEMGAFRSRSLSLVEKFIFRPQDLTSVFCSEFVAYQYVQIGVLGVGMNASRQNPNRLKRIMRRAGLLQKPVRLK